MDNVYKSKSVNAVDVQEFLESYQKQLLRMPTLEIGENEDESGIDLDLISHPEDVRVLTADLKKNYMRREMNSLSVPKKAMKLRCVEERIRQWSNKRIPEGTNKYKTARFIEPRSETEVKEAKDEEDAEPVLEIEPFSDVLITVRIMTPLKYSPYTKHYMKMDREIVFLGQNYLHEFRDMITCECDTVGPFVDISKDPGANVRAKDPLADKVNSGFLFIGDTFYNDMRIEGNSDYSKEIIAWAKQQPEIKELNSAVMEKTTFLDLKRIRLGFPYVYQHFGECEHVFIISDIRVIAATDNRIRSDYPYLQLLNNFRNIVCDVCGLHMASHSVSGSSQHIFDPARLCAKCLSSYHYVDGKKIGEFAAYRFRN